MKNYTTDDYKKVCALLDRVSGKVSIFYRYNDYFLHTMEQNPRFRDLFYNNPAANIPANEVNSFTQEYLDKLYKIEDKVRCVAPLLDANPVNLFQYVALNEKMFTNFEQLSDEQIANATEAVNKKTATTKEALNSLGITQKDVKDYEDSIPDDFKLE